MRIDAYAREYHHAEHIIPVWRALAPESRGRFYVTGEIVERFSGVPEIYAGHLEGGPAPILTSASGSMIRASRAGRTNVAIMEHGCGQSFGGDTMGTGRRAAENPSYSGGEGRTASLFLHPGPHPAARDRARYPHARVEIVGCPKLDTLPDRIPDGIPTVAFSFHWDTALSPETKSTFIFYRRQLEKLAKEARDFRVIGHGHPRIMERLAPWYERKDIEIVRSFEDVCRRADLYVMDGVSTLYEFASTGRPVIVLNAPFYRREIEHGLRFWSAAHVGVNIWEPYDIHAMVRRVLAAPQADRLQREDALSQVYAFRSGGAERAALVLEDWAARL